MRFWKRKPKWYDPIINSPASDWKFVPDHCYLTISNGKVWLGLSDYGNVWVRSSPSGACSLFSDQELSNFVRNTVGTIAVSGAKT